MEHDAAEELPALYRAILDRVGELEAAGDRVTARTLRTKAIRIYSLAWDDRARRKLQNLLRRSSGESARVETARPGARELSTTV